MICFVEKKRLLPYLLVLLVCTPVVHAASGDPLDVRILVDASKALHESDSLGLRSQTVRSLVSQIPEDAVAGVWGYAHLTQRYAKHAKATGLWKQVASVHAEHLSAMGVGQNPQAAFDNVLWDLTEPDRGEIHLVWLSDGGIRLDGQAASQESQEYLLNTLANRLAANRVVLHTAFIGPVRDDSNVALLMQLSQVTGGIHRNIETEVASNELARDIVRRAQAGSEAVVDALGRFKIATGTERFTVMWQRDDQQLPSIVRPDGERLHRMTAIPNGRWLLADEFEMATIESPVPGWWKVEGPAPLRLGVYGDLAIKVQGLRSPVIPSEETSVLIELFHWGRRVEHGSFLDLLDVQATMIQAGVEQPLPIQREGSGYRAYFVNLQDGAYELVVKVQGPTFTNRLVLPFEARNPLRVEVAASDGLAAWLSFSHHQVRYDSLRVSAKVRRPPNLGVIVPAQALPAGLWLVPLENTEGIVEMNFSLAGNYLNGEGFFLKTKPITLNLPLTSEDAQVFHFDAQGERLDAIEVANRELDVSANAPEPEPELVVQATPVPEVVPQEPPAKTLPMWFVGAISFVSLLIAAALWWFLRPRELHLPESDLAVADA